MSGALIGEQLDRLRENVNRRQLRTRLQYDDTEKTNQLGVESLSGTDCCGSTSQAHSFFALDNKSSQNLAGSSWNTWRQ